MRAAPDALVVLTEAAEADRTQVRPLRGRQGSARRHATEPACGQGHMHGRQPREIFVRASFPPSSLGHRASKRRIIHAPAIQAATPPRVTGLAQARLNPAASSCHERGHEVACFGSACRRGRANVPARATITTEKGQPQPRPLATSPSAPSTRSGNHRTRHAPDP